MATALVTGISGQDGIYLARQLMDAGHRVVGVVRTGRMSPTTPVGVDVVPWDFEDVAELRMVLREVCPVQVYNLAAFSTGEGMYDDPSAIGDLNGIAVARILQAIMDVDPTIRFCQASSSEMFGDPVQSPQTETTAFRPQSPYAAAKLFAHTVVGTFRTRHRLFACSAILYNHESPLRGPAFVTRKIADGVARIKVGRATSLQLGNIEARRDWGFAPDYVRAMRLMLDHTVPGDYLVATGELHSVREFCEIAFAHVGLNWRDWVQSDNTDPRNDTRGPMVGDATKLRETLGWRPTFKFDVLVRLMVDASLVATASTEAT